MQIHPLMILSSTARMLTERLDECRRQMEFYKNPPKRLATGGDRQRLLYWKCEHDVCVKCLMALEDEVHPQLAEAFERKAQQEKQKGKYKSARGENGDWN